MLRELWRRTGSGLVGPLVLVGATGLLSLFDYNANPDVANARLAMQEPLFAFVRSLHLWSSRALLAGAVVHTAWVWYDGRVGGPHRRAYLSGVLFLALIGFGHVTGHILRWDELGRRLADFAPVSASSFLPLHVAVVGAMGLVAAIVHFTWSGYGPAVRADPARSRDLGRSAVASICAWTAATAILTVAFPPLTAQATMAWPLGPFARVADATGRPELFTASAVVVLVSLAALPFLTAWRGLSRSIQWLLAAVFAASLLPY